MKDLRIHTVINLLSEGIEDNYGIIFHINIKEAYHLSVNDTFMWGNELSLMDEIGMFFGKKIESSLSKEEWKKMHREFRKFNKQLSQECNNWQNNIL